MVASITTATANFNALLQTLIRKQLEENLRSPLPYLLAGNVIPATLVKGSNGTMRFLAIGDMPVDVSDGSDIWVQTEGEPNDSEDLDFGFEEFSSRQAMFTIRLTDVAMLESPIELVPVAAERATRRALELANAIIAKVVLGGSNVYLVGGGSTAADIGNDNGLTGFAIRDAVSELEVTNVPTFSDGYYRAFLHPYVKLDLTGDTDTGGWIDVAKYATPESFLNGELGRYGGVRFIKSNTGAKIADAGASSNDVYATPIVGPDFAAFGDFANSQQYFTPPGGHDDPAHQSALVSWKGWMGAFLLGEGDNASGPVTEPRYILVKSAVSKSTS